MRLSTVLLIAAALAAGLAVGKFAASPGAAASWFAPRPAELHPDDPRRQTGDRRVAMLAAEWCGYCEKLRKDFELAQVRYRLIDIDTPEGERAMRAMGARGVPVTIVGQDVIHGYQPEQIRQRLAPLGYRL